MKINLAIIQIDTQDNKEKNLAKLAELIDEAAKKKAHVVSMAEMVSYLGKNTLDNLNCKIKLEK